MNWREWKMNCDLFLKIAEEWKKEVCIFGAGNNGQTWVYYLLLDAGFNISFYIDNYKSGFICNGLNVYSINKLKDNDDVYVFVSPSGKDEESIVSQLEAMGITKIYHFESEYAPVDFAHYLYKNANKGLINKYKSVMDDEEYIKIRYRYRMKKDIELNPPITFNEKLNWLKIYDRNPKYSLMVDKYEVKKIVAEMIGESYVIPTLGIWDDFDSIDFSELPEQFVLKCTHDSGSVIICRNKQKFDYLTARKKLQKAQELNPFWADREWPYLGVKPRIIAEKYVSSESENLEVFKIFNLNGIPRMIQVIQDDKTSYETIDYFDTDWNLLDLRQNYPNSITHIERPACLNEMLLVAKKLSKDIPCVRTDFYVVDNHIMFSEYTFFSDSGSERFYPDKWDYILGELLELPDSVSTL